MSLIIHSKSAGLVGPTLAPIFWLISTSIGFSGWNTNKIRLVILIKAQNSSSKVLLTLPKEINLKVILIITKFYTVMRVQNVIYQFYVVFRTMVIVHFINKSFEHE